MPKQMAKRYFELNKDRIKRWIERRYDFNPFEDITFEEFCEEFPTDAGFDEPKLEWFFEEHLYNFMELSHIKQIQQEMELLFDELLGEFMQGIEEQEAERWEFQREYREAI